MNTQEAIRILKELEWARRNCLNEDICLNCCGTRGKEGHSNTCQFAKALALLEQAEPEPGEFKEWVRKQDFYGHSGEDAGASQAWEVQQRKIDRLNDEKENIILDNDGLRMHCNVLASEKQAQAERIAKLKQAVEEGLSMARLQWAEVGNHPASRFAKDVAYFEQALKGGE